MQGKIVSYVLIFQYYSYSYSYVLFTYLSIVSYNESQFDSNLLRTVARLRLQEYFNKHKNTFKIQCADNDPDRTIANHAGTGKLASHVNNIVRWYCNDLNGDLGMSCQSACSSIYWYKNLVTVSHRKTHTHTGSPEHTHRRTQNPSTRMPPSSCSFKPLPQLTCRFAPHTD